MLTCFLFVSHQDRNAGEKASENETDYKNILFSQLTGGESLFGYVGYITPIQGK